MPRLIVFSVMILLMLALAMGMAGEELRRLFAVH